METIDNKVKKVEKKYQVLVLGDYKANTGFGIVMNNLLPRIAEILKDEWHFDVCAINYFGEAYQETENVYVFSGKIVSAMSSNPKDSIDDFGRTAFLRVLYNSNAEVEADPCHPTQMGYNGLFIVQDAPVACGMVPNLDTTRQEFKKKNKKDFKSILYFPVDNNLVPAFIKDLEFFDGLYTYNEWSRKTVLNFKPDLKGKLKLMPHGIDYKQFYPIVNKGNFRKEYFGENADKFIVLNLNRNQPRKDIPCTIFGFQEYHKSYPNSFLYLHMNPLDPLGWQLRLVLEQTDLQEGRDYMFPPPEVQNHGTDVNVLNKIYNACDVYLTTTLGEGWGLGVTEAMAAGLPVIAPYHTSFMEIGDHGKRLYPLENLYPVCGITDSVIREQCDFMEVALKLQLVEQHKDESSDILRDKIIKARNYMITLDWDQLAAKWADIIVKTF